jgi:long-chain acyl-CoA synthetase
VSALLEQLRVRDPDSIIIETHQDTVSTEQFIVAVENAAGWLGANQAQRLGLLLDNEPAWLVWDIAAQLLGICLVPLPTFFSRDQIAHIVHSMGITHIISSHALENLLLNLDRVALDIPDSGMLEFNRAFALEGAATPMLPKGTEKVTFTSGSTGKPKGVCLSTEHTLQVATSIASVLKMKSPRHLCTLPLSTLLENVAGIYQTWMQDGTVILYPLDHLGFDGGRLTSFSAFIASMNQAQPESMITVPALLMAIIKASEAGLAIPTSLQFVAVGGARVAPNLVDRAWANGIPVYEGYGLSECASVVSINSPDNSRAGTSGKVLDHIKLNRVGGELVAEGTVFLGYADQPDTWGMNCFATGDIGEISSDGFVTLSGRKKNIVITSSGRNISPEWLEGELFASGMFEQCVILANDLDHCALLCFAPAQIDSLKLEAAIESVNASLPDYAKIKQWLRLSEPLSVQKAFWTENGRPKREAIASHFIAHFLEKQDGVYDVL